MKLAEMSLREGHWSTSIGKLWWVTPSGEAWLVERRCSERQGGGWVHVQAHDDFEPARHYRLRRTMEVKTLTSVIALGQPVRTGAKSS